MRRLAVAVAVAVAAAGGLVGSARAEQAGSRARAFQAGLLDVGASHACAIQRDGSASCWGLDGNGQVGDGADGNASEPSPVAVQLAAGRTARALSAGSAFTCAILDGGSLACWGQDDAGQLGDGADGNADEPAPVTVALPAGRTATAISAGNGHACAVLDGGAVACWGIDTNGQVGDGADGNADEPAPVSVALPAGRTATAVSAGLAHTCAILDDGSVACWGTDFRGQLGDGDDGDADEPAPVAAALPVGRTATAIAAGEGHTCAILDDGAVTCWGLDGNGQVGDGADGNANQTAPGAVALPAGRTATAIAAGAGHTCAILDDGSLACWGRDSNGQLGDGADGNADEPAPVLVPLPAGSTARAVAAGGNETCVLLDDGSLSCWGQDAFGQLGDGADGGADEVSAAVAPRALSTGALASRAADVSVALEAAPASLPLTGSGSLTVRVRNAGPDAASGLRVQLLAGRLDVAATTVGQGTVDSGYWTVGSLDVAAEATLVLSLTPLAVGAGSVTAQLAAAGLVDPDSTPANGAAGEDDQATAAIAIEAPPAPAPARLAPDRLTLALTPGRDTTAPHTTRARGRLVAVSVPARAACVGTVVLTGKAGRKALLTRRAKLKLVDGACEYAAALGLTARKRGRARALTVTAAFAGNGVLLPVGSKRRTLRLA